MQPVDTLNICMVSRRLHTNVPNKEALLRTVNSARQQRESTRSVAGDRPPTMQTIEKFYPVNKTARQLSEQAIAN